MEVALDYIYILLLLKHDGDVSPEDFAPQHAHTAL